MAKKTVPVHVPLQMGFGFEVSDSQGLSPKFLYLQDDVYSALDVIEQAAWASIDCETTGLTDASMPVDLGKLEIKQGASNVVRMRTLQVRVPTLKGRSGPRQDFVFDCDKMGPFLTQRVCAAVLSRRIFIAHNAGFDLYWIRRAQGRTLMPEMVIDTMLLTRLLEPKLVLKRAELVSVVKHVREVEHQSKEVRAAWTSLVAGASGGSLADVVLAMFNTVVDKTYQKPTNWTGLLGFAHYDYANDDTYWADRIACRLLGVAEDGDVLEAYLGLRAKKATVRLIEPQVPELVKMRENGMPVNPSIGVRYVQLKRRELAKKVDELIALEPEALEKFRFNLSNPDAGLDAELKHALAQAFERRGVVLRYTAATNEPQVGEKDLRACRAAKIEGSRPLFNAWVAVCRSKKTSAMALEVVGFANRSTDGVIRSLLSHGPVTGRLSAAEPNCQQWPRDQLFRAMCISPTKPGCEQMLVEVTDLNKELLALVSGQDTDSLVVGQSITVESVWMAALFWSDKNVPNWPAADREALEQHINKHFELIIVASDFGALDVRVGAALCIRTQREMHALLDGVPVPGGAQPPDHVVVVLKDVLPRLNELDAADQLEERIAYYGKRKDEIEARLEALKVEMDSERISRKQFFNERGLLKEQHLAAKMGWRLAQCMALAYERGETEYSALRDAFVSGLDIHTFTGMKLNGRDPMKEFEGLEPKERLAKEKLLKKELGPRRQQGKIANLSLLYGMADAGFQEAAARGYDEHWTMEQTHEIRSLWMDAYPEVELWHLWTECLQEGVVYIPEAGREKPARSGWWNARTLGGREIVAFGLNAALSYQDQSSGADILGLIVHELHENHPEIFKCAINQVHDEQVFAVPLDKFEEYLPIIENLMVECANRLTMPYGVPCAVSPASGPIWVKD